jgi:hypothetical protein
VRDERELEEGEITSNLAGYTEDFGETIIALLILFPDYWEWVAKKFEIVAFDKLRKSVEKEGIPDVRFSIDCCLVVVALRRVRCSNQTNTISSYICAKKGVYRVVKDSNTSQQSLTSKSVASSNR